MMSKDIYEIANAEIERLNAAEDAIEAIRFTCVRADTRRTLLDAANAINSAMRRLRADVWEYEDAQQSAIWQRIADATNAPVREVDLTVTVHTIGGKVIDHDTNPGTYGRTHDMDCPACLASGSSFTASPRSETYWSS